MTDQENQGVTTAPPELMTARWDWYQSTVWGADIDEVGAALLMAWDLSEIRPARARHGYHHGAEVYRGDQVVARCLWGGNPGLHVLSTGHHAPILARILRDYDHAPSRIDACIDYELPGLMDDLAQSLTAYCIGKGIKVVQHGEWALGRSRTLYLGSRSSPVYLRIYEKGDQLGLEDRHGWVRLEVEVKPHKRARPAVSQWHPWQAFAGSKWLTGALEHVGLVSLTPYRIGTVRVPTDAEYARYHLLRQYGPTIRQWMSELPCDAEFVSVLRSALDLAGRPGFSASSLDSTRAVGALDAQSSLGTIDA